MRQAGVGMIGRLMERLKKLRGEPAEYASEPDCADYDNCIKSLLICIAAAED
jgi:hypothetical protein